MLPGKTGSVWGKPPTGPGVFMPPSSTVAPLSSTVTVDRAGPSRSITSSSSKPTKISEIPTTKRVSETTYDKVAEQLIAKGILNESLELVTIPAQPMPALDNKALMALVKLLTTPMTLKGRPLRQEDKPSFEATFTLHELFQWVIENGDDAAKQLIEKMLIVGGAVPWILSGSPEKQEELSTSYLEAFFKQLGFTFGKDNIPSQLIHDFGKRPSDIDVRFMAPQTNVYHLTQFCENVNTFIAKKAGKQDSPGIVYNHGFSKLNTTHDVYQEGENVKRKAEGQKELPLKKFSVIGFETTSGKAGSNKMLFDLLFVNQLPSENLFIRDALRIPIKGLILELSKASLQKDGIAKLLQEIESGKSPLKVVPESHYAEGGWQPLIDRVLGISRSKKDKVVEFSDWASLLSAYVKGKRSQQPGLESALLKQLPIAGKKETHLFSTSVQRHLESLGDDDRKKLLFFAGFGLKTILNNHHADQKGALEALTLQACLSFRDFGDLSNVGALWDEMHALMPGKKESKLTPAADGVFGKIHAAISNDRSLIGPVLDLLQIQAFAHLCCGSETADAFKATLLMHNGSPHLQVAIAGQHLLMPYDPKKALNNYFEHLDKATVQQKTLLDAISKEIGFPPSYVGGQGSVLGRNLSPLSHLGFDAAAFKEVLENAVQMPSSRIAREMFLACSQQVDTKLVSPKFPVLFSQMLKECAHNEDMMQELLKKAKDWDPEFLPISVFKALRKDDLYRDVPLQLLWALALAKSPLVQVPDKKQGVGANAYQCYEKHKTDVADPTVSKQFEQQFVCALAHSRRDLAVKMVTARKDLSMSELEPLLVSLLTHDKASTLNENEVATNHVADFVKSLVQTDPDKAAEVLAAIPKDSFSAKQEAALLLQLLQKCRVLSSADKEKMLPSVFAVITKLSGKGLNRAQLVSDLSFEDTFGWLMRDRLSTCGKEEIAAVVHLVSRFQWDEKTTGSVTSKLISQLLDRDVDIAQEIWMKGFSLEFFTDVNQPDYQELLTKFVDYRRFKTIVEEMLNPKGRFKTEHATDLLKLLQSNGFAKYLELDRRLALENFKSIVKRIFDFNSSLFAPLISDAQTKKELPISLGLILTSLFSEQNKPLVVLKDFVKAYSAKILKTLHAEKYDSEYQAFLEAFQRHFPDQVLNKDSVAVLQRMSVEEQFLPTFSLTLLKSLKSLKQHLDASDYQEFLERSLRNICHMPVTEAVFPVILDALMDKKVMQAKDWNGLLNCKCSRSLTAKATKYLLNPPKNHTLSGSPKELAEVVSSAVKKLSTAECYGCLELLKEIPRLQGYFEGQEELWQQTLDGLFEGIDSALQVPGTQDQWKKQIEDARHSVGRLSSTLALPFFTPQILTIEGGGSKSLVVGQGSSLMAVAQISNPRESFSSNSQLRLEKLLEDSDVDDILLALENLPLENISSRILKDEKLWGILKKNAQGSLNALKVLYDRSQSDRTSNLTDGILTAVVQVACKATQVDLEAWVKPLATRIASPMSKNGALGEGVIALFSRLMTAASSEENPTLFFELFSFYAHFEHEKQSEIKIDETIAESCFNVLTQNPDLLKEYSKELGVFAKAAVKLYGTGRFPAGTSEKVRSFIHQLVDVLMESGLEQDAEELLPAFVAHFDASDPIWTNKEFGTQAKRWVEKWLSHGALCDSQALSRLPNIRKLQGLLTFVMRTEHLPTPLYTFVLNKLLVVKSKELGENTWKEGWQQLRLSTLPTLDKAVRLDNLITFAFKNDSDCLYDILLEPELYNELLEADASHIVRLTSLSRVLPSIVRTENLVHGNQTPDFLKKWKVLVQKVDAYMERLSEEGGTIDKQEWEKIGNFARKYNIVYQLTKIIVEANHSAGEIDKKALQDLILFNLLSDVCSHLSQFSELMSPNTRKNLLSEVVEILIPEIKDAMNVSQEPSFSELTPEMGTVFTLFCQDASLEEILRVSDELLAIAYPIVADFANKMMTDCLSGYTKDKIAECRIGHLRNEIIGQIETEFSLYPETTSSEALIDTFVEAYNTRESHAGLLLKQNFPKACDELYQLIVIIEWAIGNLLNGYSSTCKVSKNFAHKASELILDLERTFKSRYQNHESILTIKLAELECLKTQFFKTIKKDPESSLAISRVQQSLEAIRLSFDNMIPKGGPIEYEILIAQTSVALQNLFKNHFNSETQHELMDCLDAFMFLPNPYQMTEYYGQVGIVLRAAIRKGMFEKDPVRFFKYCSDFPIEDFHPEKLVGLCNEECFTATADAISSILKINNLSLVERAVTYLECCQTGELPKQVRHIDEIFLYAHEKRAAIVNRTCESQKIKFRIFLSNPKKYFELWESVYVKVCALKEPTELPARLGPLMMSYLTLQEAQKSNFSSSCIQHLVGSYLIFLKACMSEAKMESHAAFLERIEVLLTLFKNHDMNVPFDSKTKLITLLLLSQLPKTDSELNEHARVFKSWLTILENSKDPLASAMLENARLLIARNERLNDKLRSFD